MTERRKKRNQKIIAEIKDLKKLGYKVKHAIRLVAEKHYLQPLTVRDINYSN